MKKQTKLYSYTLKEISRDGAVFENPSKKKAKRICINFADCIKNFSEEYGWQSQTCVAERDALNLTFTFYTVPKTTICFRNSRKRGRLLDYFAAKRFHSLQRRLGELGLTSYDMT